MIEKKVKMDSDKESFALDKRFVYGLVVIAVLVAVYFIAFDKTTSGVSVNDSLNDEINAVRARVNGLAVYESDVERARAVYQAQTGKILPEDIALDQAITNNLILEEADRRGIEVDKKDIRKQLSAMAKQQGVSIEQIKQGYEKKGKNFEEAYQYFVVDQLKIKKLSEEILAEVPEVTDLEATAYYEENKQVLFGNSEIIAPYSEVSDKLKRVLSQKKKQEALNEFVASLKAEAEIEYVAG